MLNILSCCCKLFCAWTPPLKKSELKVFLQTNSKMNVRVREKASEAMLARCLLVHIFSLLEKICCQVKSVREIRDEEMTFAVYLSILSDQELVSWQSGNSSSFSTAYFICFCHSILMKLRNLLPGQLLQKFCREARNFRGVWMKKFSPQVFLMSCQRFGNESLINLRCFGGKLSGVY